MEDNKIIDLLYNHDENGLEEVKSKYNKLLYSLSFNILKNDDDVNECINDVYMKIWSIIPPYKPTYLKSFICKLVRQISIDKYRYNTRNNNVLLSDLDYDIKCDSNIENSINEKLLIDEINKFIENLNAEDKVLFIRKYFMFEDVKSLSDRFGLSVTNINVKMLRVRNKLLKKLEKEGFVIEKK